MAKFLDATGLSHLVAKLKTIFAVKATTLSGYGITNGVTYVSYSGSGNVVSGGSVSGHGLTLYKNQSVPELRNAYGSLNSSVSNFNSNQVLVYDLSLLTYTAGKEFWINLDSTERNRGLGHYVGYVFTGSETCFIKFGGLINYVIGGNTLLAASSLYRFEMLCKGCTSGDFKNGYLVWQRVGPL